MEQNITYKKLIDKLEEFANKHPKINSFGFGNLVDFGKDVENTAPLYPLLFVVPGPITYEQNSLLLSLQIFFADKLNDDLEGSVSIISDMSMISRDLMSVFKLNEDFMYLAEIDDTLSAQPFQERFNDVLAGVATTFNFRVSNYLEVCELNDDLGPQLYLDLTRSNIQDPTLRYSPNIFISRVNNETGDSDVWWELDTEEGISPYDEYPKKVQVNIPLDTEPNKYRYSVFALGYQEPIFNAELLNGNEPYSADTCNNGLIFTFTGDGKTDWYWNVYPDYDCIDYPIFNVITSNGFTEDDVYPIEWRLEVQPSGGGDIRTYPSPGEWVIVRQSQNDYDFSRFYYDGDEVSVYIRDNRAGQGDTFMSVELEGTEVFTEQCFGEIEYTFTLTGESTHNVYLQGRLECAPLPTPTQTPTLTPSATLTPTPTITTSPTITPTPSATPGPVGPQPPSGMVHWYDFQDNSTMSISSSGGTDYITGIDNKAPSYLGVYDLTNTIGGNTYPTLETNISGFTGHADTGQTNGAQGAKFIDTATTSDRRYLGITGGTNHDYTGYTAVHIMKYHNPSNKSFAVINHNDISSSSSSSLNTRMYGNSTNTYLFHYNTSSFSNETLSANIGGSDFQDIRNRYFADTIRLTTRLNFVEDEAPMMEHNNTFIAHNNWRSMTGGTGTTKNTFTYGYQVYNNGSSVSNFTDGDNIVLETIIYDRVLNDTDWNTLEEYLDYKYGNPIDISESQGLASGWTENEVVWSGQTNPVGFLNLLETRFQLFGDTQLDVWSTTNYANNNLRMILPIWYDEVQPTQPVSIEMRVGNFNTGTYPGNRFYEIESITSGSVINGPFCSTDGEVGTFYDWNNTSGRVGLRITFDPTSSCIP